MKAVVVHGAGDLRVDELPDPAPGPGEVLIAMEWGGICGSDLAYRRHGSSGTAVLRRPMVLGHEMAGRIAALGLGVTGLRDRAAGHRAPGRPWSATACLPEPARRPHQPVPGDPLLRFGGVRPAHRRRVQRAEGRSRRTDPGAARGREHRTRLAGGAARRGAARGAAGPVTSAVATCWSTGPGRSGAWWSRPPSTGRGHRRRRRPLRLLAGRGQGDGRGQDGATWPQGDILPEDAELVFEASGAPAALGGVLRGHRPRRHPGPGRQPARNGGARGAR